MLESRTRPLSQACANESCIELVPLTLGEYDTVRAKSNRFFVVADDARFWADVERVVQRTDRYWIVEKISLDPG